MAAHPGATLTEARGHGKSPEHPSAAERHPEKYEDYLGRRRGLQLQLISLKQLSFGTSDKWRADRSQRNVLKDPATGQPPTLAKLERAIGFLDGTYSPDDEETYDFEERDDDFGSLLWYH